MLCKKVLSCTVKESGAKGQHLQYKCNFSSNIFDPMLAEGTDAELTDTKGCHSGCSKACLACDALPSENISIHIHLSSTFSKPEWKVRNISASGTFLCGFFLF